MCASSGEYELIPAQSLPHTFSDSSQTSAMREGFRTSLTCRAGSRSIYRTSALVSSYTIPGNRIALPSPERSRSRATQNLRPSLELERQGFVTTINDIMGYGLDRFLESI